MLAKAPDDSPLGIAPLYVRRRGRSLTRSLRAVMFLGTGEPEQEEVCGEANGWLCAPEHVGAVSSAVAAALRAHARGWERVELRHFGSPTSDVEAVVGRLRPVLADAATRTFATRRAVVASLPEFVGCQPSRTRRERFRRLLRRADEAGVRLVRAATAGQALSMFDELVALHQRSWRARGQPGACGSRVFREFHRRVIAREGAAGRLWLFGLRLADGRWAGLHYDIVAGDTLYYYLSGIDYEAAGHLSPGKLLLLHAIDMAAGAGLRRLDLMGGDYRFKRELATEAAHTVTFEGVSRSPLPRAWQTLRRLKRRMVSFERPASASQRPHLSGERRAPRA